MVTVNRIIRISILIPIFYTSQFILIHFANIVQQTDNKWRPGLSHFRSNFSVNISRFLLPSGYALLTTPDNFRDIL